ncbi:hypothetical protein K470DRAFT_256633 [Piedraia hortae CBS 480.64]|uniref:Phosphoserine phosphatase n=1 Tax=Piedraia hortae CBS 480.64 TaxID=1314780 RepID=A0A6A7C508_9PEZI|nr:hypothetical protein K470DRAFT_256633 [Piedraia hortae CBS 480.64]
MTDNLGFGVSKRKQGNLDVLEGRKSFRESFTEMMNSIRTPFPECITYLTKNITLDPHFKNFLTWSLSNKIPTVIVSSGMEDIIRTILQHNLGAQAEQLDIISNYTVAREGKKIDEQGGWRIEFHDDSHFGHDKSLTLRRYAELPGEKRPVMFYAGDGVSDLSAAREADLLFAKRGHDLIKYCVKEDVPFTVFGDWGDILEGVKRIVEGRLTVQEAAREGVEMFKRGESGV